jgi:hypothetical protein
MGRVCGGKRCIKLSFQYACKSVEHSGKVLGLMPLQVRQVACGGMHSLALTEGGEVWTWGEPWGDFSLYLDRNPRQVRSLAQYISVAMIFITDEIIRLSLSMAVGSA